MTEEKRPMLKPEEFRPTNKDGSSVLNSQGKPCVYTLTNFPATVGREIISLYPTSALPKVGDYEINRKVAQKLMSYVAVIVNGVPLFLETDALVDNHVPDAETHLKIEMAMMEKNYSFFHDGRLSDFFDQATQTILQKALEILTPLLEQSSPTTKPPLQN